ncbi:ABC transporter permease [Agathobaculum sp. Marseille-P7918]|uniref:ABC transporter permease n=1 Tax=Agathobaculum sp. Marseille-P7918 TaxID=2479843 RepID=UPI0019D11C65|nr:ABC transporter permease [Agathobaculum sp. Marseille-P7918]
MKNIRKICIWAIVIFIILAVGFRLVAAEGFSQGTVHSTMVTEKAVVGELLAGTSVTQTFRSECDQITGVTVLGTTYGNSVEDTLHFSLCNSQGDEIASASLDTVGLPDCEEWFVSFSNAPSGYRDQILTLNIVSENGLNNHAVSLFYGDSQSAGRYEVKVANEYPIIVNGTEMEGQLCLSVSGENIYKLARYYWAFVVILFGGLLLLCGWILHCTKVKKNTMVLRFITAFIKYRFLLKQLVSRDFKTKYKRSVLGVLWSLMNPLLTMMVMYIVFSTLFKSNISNFPVYLLTGIVCWNYFSEVTNACLTSITGNAALITKVYVPKYIYPVSRALSASVNLSLSLVPLFVVLLITKTQISPRWLLLPFPIVCLFAFSLGIGLLLASSMVFFHDTQFLWGVISMLWMYFTPIFYAVDIIPLKFLTLYKVNPLYHIIRIMRILLMDGVSPEPKAYILCLFASGVPLLLGALVFKTTQDRFALFL